jgi:hypothetical protein
MEHVSYDGNLSDDRDIAKENAFKTDQDKL